MHVASLKNESQIILAFCDFALYKKYTAAACLVFWLAWFCLVWFYGISTIESYLMPDPVHTYMIYMICKQMSTKLDSSKYCYVSLTIQLNISHLFTHN